MPDSEAARWGGHLRAVTVMQATLASESLPFKSSAVPTGTVTVTVTVALAKTQLPVTQAGSELELEE